MDLDEFTRLGDPPDIAEFGPVEGVHIIPFSYGSWNERLREAPREILKAWEVLFRCFPSLKQIGFEASQINDLSNGLILRDWLHARFRKFGFAFSKTETPHLYDIDLFQKFSRSERSKFPGQADFRACEGAIEDRPRPELLDCHWRLAKILHASAMGEAFDQDFQEWEELRDLPYLHPGGKTNIGHGLRCHLDMWADSKSRVQEA